MNQAIKELDNYFDFHLELVTKFANAVKAAKKDLEQAAQEIFFNEQLNFNPEPAKILSKAEVEQKLTELAITTRSQFDGDLIKWIDDFRLKSMKRSIEDAKATIQKNN